MAIPTNSSKRRPVRPVGGSAESSEGERRKAVRKPANGAEGQQRRRVMPPSEKNEQSAPSKRRPVEGNQRRRPISEQEVRRKKRPNSDEDSAIFLNEQEKIKKEDPALQKQSPKKVDENESTVFQPSVDQESIDNPEYAKDPVTGKVYQKIPKTKLDKDGMPMIQTNIDDLDLQSAANQFLAHLRVAPSKEEIAKMRQERIRRAREARNKDKRAASSQEELERKFKESRNK